MEVKITATFSGDTATIHVEKRTAPNSVGLRVTHVCRSMDEVRAALGCVLVSMPLERELVEFFDKARIRDPFTATCTASVQGFPVRVPERLLERKVRITIEDLGPAL